MKHNKHTKHKIKNLILKSITYLMGIIFLVSIAALDSKLLYIPLISLSISGAWLYLMAWANGYLYK